MIEHGSRAPVAEGTGPVLPPRLGAAPIAQSIPFADLKATNREVRAQVDAAVRAVFDSGRFIGGPAVERFETEWADFCGSAHAVGVANGTDAIQLTLQALGIGAGDEVIVPANTFVATAEAVVLAGAVPRFADVDPDTLLLTPATVEHAITPRTRAVIVVHLYGQTADMSAIAELAARTGLVVLEDAAQAHGAHRDGRVAGSFAVAGSFSFYPGKNLGAFGDAGAVVTDDGGLADTLRSMRDHGRRAGSHYEHDLLGTNSRMDAVQAAVLSEKLPRLAEWTAARQALAARYRAELAGGPVDLVRNSSGDRGHSYHLMVARVPFRDDVRTGLASTGIETSIHYPVPCHLQAPFRRFADGRLPVTEQAADQLISLPMFPHMSEEQVGRVCEQLQELVTAREDSDVA